MKQKIWKMSVAAAVVGAGVWVGLVAGNPLQADSAVTPGSIEDPIASISYVDEQIAKLEKSIGGIDNGGTNGPGDSETDSETSVKLEVVTLPIGKTLMAASGSEVVVRVGKAIAYSSDTNGISDVTGGTDIKSGREVPRNHLIWFPRDGRGIKGHPTEVVPLTVLVKGYYTIQ